MIKIFPRIWRLHWQCSKTTCSKKSWTKFHTWKPSVSWVELVRCHWKKLKTNIPWITCSAQQTNLSFSTFYWSNLLNISHFVSPNPRLYHLHHCYNVPQLGDYLAHITPCPTLSQDSWNMLRTFVSVLDHQSWEPASVCMTHNHFGKFRQTLIFLCTVKPV